MATILPETFPVGPSGELASLSRPALHGMQIIVRTVVAPQPVSLAGVFGEHRAFALERARHIDHELRVDDPALAVPPLQRVHVIEVRNCIQNGRRPLAPRTVVGYRGAETRVSNQSAGRF